MSEEHDTFSEPVRAPAAGGMSFTACMNTIASMYPDRHKVHILDTGRSYVRFCAKLGVTTEPSCHTKTGNKPYWRLCQRW